MTPAELEQEIREEFPAFKIVQKSTSRLMRAIDIFLKVITFGLMRTFMTRFITTIGYTVYVTEAWSYKSPNARMITLRHERVHMRQRKRYGALWFGFLYLFSYFPLVFAYHRAKFEKEAYEETLNAIAELMPSTGMKTLQSLEFREMIVRHFTSAEYFWMWPFRKSIETWYDGIVSRISRRRGKRGS